MERELDSIDIDRAELLAAAAHRDQFDKGGKPRFLHVEHVARCFTEPVFIIVGYLHDTLEDSFITTKECLAKTFSKEVADAVDAITRRQGESYFEYLRRCKENRIARLVKIADIEHNMDRSRWPEMPDSYHEREVKALELLKD